MKTRTLSRILEGIFLFTLILMIYIMSIFSAKGQMVKELATPSEFMLSYANEESFTQERMMNMNFQFFNSPLSRKQGEQNESPYLPEYSIVEKESIKSTFKLPKMDLRRRRAKEHQAPSFVIPFN
ncbi:hypothetical protein [Ekhidna sp. To15]|uniref:hypothetical protein n=1 Tax=Ekhidna sp. To15 TaxID=3395267 RepID=UPI003F51C505